MNLKTATVLLLFCLPFIMKAEQPVTNITGDISGSEKETEDQKITWVHPGTPGNCQVWNYSHVDPANSRYVEKNRGDRDEWLTGREKETAHYYFFSGDSLFCSGYENEMTLVKYSQPQLLIHFPLNYAKSSKEAFSGRGQFGDQSELTLTGNISTMVDGWGELILPGGRSLKNVFRVHIVILSRRQIAPLSSNFDLYAPVDEKAGATDGETAAFRDGAWIVESIYQWYVADSCYPVFETQETRIVNENENDPVAVQRSTFLYNTSGEGRFQTNSDENQLYRTMNRVQFQYLNLHAKDLQISYQLYPNPVRDRLQVTINPTGKVSVTISLYDMHGRLLRQLPAKEASDGYTETLDMTGLAKGSYLLRIQTGNDTVHEKIVKQ